MTADPDSAPAGGLFPATRWTVVLNARSADSESARAALEDLCRSYWRPLYVFLRQRGCSPDDASDHVQGFFLHLLKREFVHNVAPDQGKLRSFLLTALKNYLADEHERASAKKRGGGQSLISLEAMREAETAFEPSTHESPDGLFDVCWARQVIADTHAALRREYAAAGRTALFERLSKYLTEDVDGCGYADIARDLDMNEPAVRKASAVLRTRFGQTIRRLVAETVPRSEDLDGELRHLLAALRNAQG